MITLKLDKSKKYLLACSYGPDSMCLFDILLNGGYNFACAHVNYGLRKEAFSETSRLQQYCKEKNIKIYIKYVENKIIKNIEEVCREIRYDFFKEIVEKDAFDAVLIAHNEDDNIETYILQTYRKSIVNCYGLQPDSYRGNVRILRPLLNFSKAKLQKYDDKNEVPYAIDSSNFEDNFLRNKIRHSIVEKMTKNERTFYLKTIKSLNLTLKENREKILRKNTNLIEDLLLLDDVDLAYLLTLKAREHDSSIELSMKRVKELRKVLASKKPNISVKLKNNLYFVKSYNKYEIKKIVKNTDFMFVIKEPCEFDCKYFYLNFNDNQQRRNVCNDDYPITVRSALKKDIMVINNHCISLRRQFINWKMPIELRTRWPVICDKNGKIIYVPKYSPNFLPDSTSNFFVKI